MVQRNHEGRLYGTVKVGDRGQIVIPSQCTKRTNINPGDLLFVMTSRNHRGLTMVKADAMREFAEKIMQELEVTQPETRNMIPRKNECLETAIRRGSAFKG